MLLLFDIDGTLLHTNGLSKEIFCRALGETYGVPVAWTYASYHGQPDRYLARDLLRAHGLADELVESQLAAAFDRVGELWSIHREEARRGMTIYPGVRELLALLAADWRVTLGQVTANARPAAIGKLRAAGIDESLFPIGAYGDEADERRELPLLAIGRAEAHAGRSFHPSDVVIIGDSPADIQAARACGARCVAVATGYTPAAELAAHEPDLLLPDFSNPGSLLTTLGL